MKILVFQHVAGENGGSIQQNLLAGGADLTVVNFERGHAIPPVDPYDAMFVLGGPMDVWDVDTYPWLVDEKRAIRRFVRELSRPYLGLCLGHQLLADALGGTCGPQKPKQVGSFRIELTAEGQASALFAGLDPVFNAFKWHGVHVAQMPEGAVRLAGSKDCRCEAMQATPLAFGIQFHPEFTAGTLDEWNAIPGTPKGYRTHFGENGLETAKALSRRFLPEYLGNAARLSRNFLQIMRG